MGEGNKKIDNYYAIKVSFYEVKIDCYIFKMFKVRFRVTTKQKSIVNTCKIKRTESKYTITENNQFTKKKSKRESKKETTK